ncbi:unnamed protein product [Caenorhabditis brenneri]
MLQTVHNFTNPIFASVLHMKTTDQCYCYRTIHSVQNFYIFTAITIAVTWAILIIFFVFGDRFFHEKYRHEYAMGSGSKETDRDRTVDG